MKDSELLLAVFPPRESGLKEEAKRLSLTKPKEESRTSFKKK